MLEKEEKDILLEVEDRLVNLYPKTLKPQLLLLSDVLMRVRLGQLSYAWEMLSKEKDVSSL